MTTVLIVEGVEGPRLAVDVGFHVPFEEVVDLVRRVAGWIREVRVGPVSAPGWIYVRSAEGVDRMMAEIQQAIADKGIVYAQAWRGPSADEIRATPRASLAIIAPDEGPLAMIARALGAAAADAAYVMHVGIQAMCPRRAVIVADAIHEAARTGRWPKGFLLGGDR